MKKTIITMICILLIISSCKRTNNEISYIRLEPIASIDELNDSSFFKGISYMLYNDNCVYASDDHNSRILKLDTALNFLGAIANGGPGPEEFAGIGCIAVYKDTVLAVNYGGLSLNSYTKDGLFIDRHSIKDPSITENNFCLNGDGFLYFTSKLDTFPIVKYDRNMNRLQGFGDWIAPENKEDRYILNNYLISCLDDKIFTIQMDAPIIHLYGKDGQLLLRKELSPQLFEKRLKFRESEQRKNPSNLKKVYILFSSITSFDNKIYVLYIDHDDRNLPVKNKVIELVYKNNDFIINKIYDLNRQDWFSSIVVTSDNRLIALNVSKGELCIYKLK